MLVKPVVKPDKTSEKLKYGHSMFQKQEFKSTQNVSKISRFTKFRKLKIWSLNVSKARL